MRASVCLEPKLEQSLSQDRSRRAHGQAEELERNSAGGREPRFTQAGQGWAGQEWRVEGR